ncbi:response regulator receiver protein [Pseudoalteromonas luteoviolacea B = ATCC 29581]|nr:response regulator receiver protein [Pseudoalteromonas luteoviolacea B = ATCC 29581]
MMPNHAYSHTEIILVEDDPDDVYLFLNACDQLAPKPKVRVLSGGQALLDYVEQQDCQQKLILLDLNMPNMSGLETMMQLSTNEKLKHLCWVGFSTSNNAKDISKAYELGAKSFISKPATLSEMTELVKTLSLYWFKFNRFYKDTP